MTFSDLKVALKQIPCTIQSDAVEHYFEAVFACEQLEVLSLCLQNYFGKPAKDAHEQPTAMSDTLAGRYGGVKADQILYARKLESGVELALLWPWSSKKNITLKLIRG